MDEFIKQPIYYALSHFSAFLPRHSHRVHSQQHNNADTHGLSLVAARTPVHTVLVALNEGDDTLLLAVCDASRPGVTLHVRVQPHSLVTVLYS